MSKVERFYDSESQLNRVWIWIWGDFSSLHLKLLSVSYYPVAICVMAQTMSSFDWIKRSDHEKGNTSNVFHIIWLNKFYSAKENRQNGWALGIYGKTGLGWYS